jgi:hypothetical protein
MSMKSKWIFILVGDDRTGKTQVQKNLIKLLSDDNRDIRLDCNLLFQITHPYLIRKFRDFSIGNRSFQEKIQDYKSIPNYFQNHFCHADLCFISSHLNSSDINQMITEGHRRFYNVCGVFFTNSIVAAPDNNATISELGWNERWVATNDPTTDEPQQNRQLQNIAETFVQMLIARTQGW